MEALKAAVAGAMAGISTSTNGSSAPLPSPTKNSELPLLLDASGRETLALFLAQCFEALKTWGKEPEQIKAVNGLFQMVLADYPIEKIRSAFAAYFKTNADMPAPADIVQLIERGNRPKLDRAVYVAICKRHDAERFPQWTSEWQYMRDFERFQMTGRMS